MKINVTGIYRSITAFESDDLNDFTMITGRNGSGKSQLLEMIRFRNDPNKRSAFALHINPSVGIVQSGGIDNIGINKINDGAYLGHVAPYRDFFSNLHQLAASPLVQQIVAQQADITRLLASDESYYAKIFEGKSQVEVFQLYNKLSGTTSHPNDIKTLNLYWFHFLQTYQKHIEAIIHLCDASQKTLNELELDDFTKYILPAKFVDVGELFASKIELIFWSYAKRRFHNDFKYYRKTLYKSDNQAISDDDFLSRFPPPWQTLNDILKDCNVDIRFQEISMDDMPQFNDYQLGFVKEGLSSTIPYESLSAGERVVVGLVIRLFASSYHEHLILPDLLLLDEPDAHLHPSLTQLLLNVLYETFVKKYRIRVIMTTHSPTTVALTPEECIYKMENNPNCSLTKVSKDDALSLLTELIPTLSIDYRNHRQVFVESLTDVIYYQALYNEHQVRSPFRHKLYFISQGGGKTNCDWVIKIVGQLRESGSTTCRGIVDWDKINQGNAGIWVHGKDTFYSVENFILLPIYMVVYLLEKNAHNAHDDLSIRTTENIYNIGNWEVVKLQQASDWVVNKIIEKFPALKSQQGTYTVAFENGAVISTPVWLLSMQGHELEQKYKATFQALETFRKEGDLQAHFSKNIARCYPFVPSETIATFRAVAQ